eukprot:274510-Prorocentrum_minimum.AAC.2
MRVLSRDDRSRICGALLRKERSRVIEKRRSEKWERGGSATCHRLRASGACDGADWPTRDRRRLRGRGKHATQCRIL